jgi:catalase
MDGVLSITSPSFPAQKTNFCIYVKPRQEKIQFPPNDWTYTFRNREFQVNEILKIFLCEYTEELFNGYEKYLNIEEIKEYLQKVVNT